MPVKFNNDVFVLHSCVASWTLIDYAIDEGTARAIHVENFGQRIINLTHSHSQQTPFNGT